LKAMVSSSVSVLLDLEGSIGFVVSVCVWRFFVRENAFCECVFVGVSKRLLLMPLCLTV
jgi:hypothetical protein